DGDALSALAANAVVGDAVRPLLTQLGAQSLRLTVMSCRVDLLEFPLSPTEIVETRASDGGVEHLEIQILRGRLRRLEKRDAMMLRFGNRCRLVSRCVVDAE